jgi:predicted ATPase
LPDTPLEGVCREDHPDITLTVEQDGKTIVARFAQLSFGQKASILLGALLFADRSDPLVIDQPEDHLDSAFIYEAVVRTLRKVKERRQVIVATHNANIAVHGDAELVVPLRSWTGRGFVADRGSVDVAATRKRACMILEGGEQAYRRRGEMYGLQQSP